MLTLHIYHLHSYHFLPYNPFFYPMFKIEKYPKSMFVCIEYMEIEYIQIHGQISTTKTWLKKWGVKDAMLQFRWDRFDSHGIWIASVMVRHSFSILHLFNFHKEEIFQWTCMDFHIIIFIHLTRRNSITWNK